MQIRTPVDHSPHPPPFPSGSAIPLAPTAFVPSSKDALWLSEDKIGSLTHTQCKMFNEGTVEIRVALQEQNLRAARAKWSALAEQQLVQFFGPPHYGQYDRLLLSIQRRKQALLPEELAALEEMTLFVAAGGSPEALKEYMRSQLKDGNPDAVVRLYQRYLALQKERTDSIWHVTGHAEHTAGSDDDTEEDPTSSLRGKPILRIPQAFPLYAIAAHAIRGALLDALQVALQTPSDIDSLGITNAINDLAVGAKLTEEQLSKARKFMQNCQLAIRLQRPSTFATFTGNLTRDGSPHALKVFYTRVVGVLLSENSWIALRPSEVSPSKPVLLPDFAWASWSTAFLRRRDLKLAGKMWDDMLKLGVQPTPDVWVALIDGYSDMRLIDRVRSVWSMIIHENESPTALMYRAAISAEFSAGHGDEALSLFHEFVKQSARAPAPVDLALSLIVHNTVLAGLLRLSREKDALELLEGMRQRGPAPDTATYNTLMRYHTKKSNIKALAETIEEMNAAELKGDIYTYSIVLEALVPVRPDAVQVVFGLMKQQNIEPNVVMYTSIIGHLMQQHTDHGFKGAMAMLRRMEAEKSEEARPNEVTYTTILTELYRDNWLDPTVVDETVQLITDRMYERKLLNRRVTYNLLIKACLENPTPVGLTNAMKYYYEMRSRRILITSDTWYILLRGLRARKEIGMAVELIDVIEQDVREPSPALQFLIERVKHAARYGAARRA